MRSRIALAALAALSLPAGLVAQPAAPAALPPAVSDAGQRVVAYIHGTVPITREELGEYLIARYGAEKLQLLVNTRIIEMACKARHIDITEAEIEAAIEEDLAGLNIKRGDFAQLLKKEYGQSVLEWKLDVVRPRVLLSKLCRERIQITEDELKQMYEFRYGRKVQVRIIMWPPGQDKQALSDFEKIRQSDDAFDRAARSQHISTLAATGGVVNPIAKGGATSNDIVEQEAFKLQQGELSRLISTPQGTMVLKCVGHVEPKTGHDFQKERPELMKAVYDRRISMEIPKVVEALRAEAKPQVFLKNDAGLANVKGDAEETLRATAPAVLPAGAKSGGK